MRNTVLLELDKNIYNTIISNGIDISGYVLKSPKCKVDETEYLTSTKKNKYLMDKAVEDVKNKKNLTKVRFEDL
jgi:arginyl-tRNA--protein-N-Asp/Glu arginylyltransferase